MQKYRDSLIAVSTVKVANTDFVFPFVAICGYIPYENEHNVSLLSPEDSFEPWIDSAEQNFMVEDGDGKRRQDLLFILNVVLN